MEWNTIDQFHYHMFALHSLSLEHSQTDSQLIQAAAAVALPSFCSWFCLHKNVAAIPTNPINVRRLPRYSKRRHAIV